MTPRPEQPGFATPEEASLVSCERHDGQWYEGDGEPGISYDAGMPDEVYERLRSLGYL